MSPKRPTLLAALLLAPAAVMPAAAADPPQGEYRRPTAARAPVAVYRGGRASVPPAVAVYRGTRASVPPAVPVYRGDPAPTPALDEAEVVPEGPEYLAAGNRLWVVDREARSLTACRVQATTQVGRDRVRCVARGLPDGLAE